MKKILIFSALVALCVFGGSALCDESIQQGKDDNATLASADNATLILYYSKTGKTKVVAEALRDLQPGATLYEVKSDVSIPAAIFWYKFPFTKVDIEPLEIDFDNYSQVFLCTPVYMQGISPPIKAVIKDAPLEGKKVAVFATCGGFYGSLMHGLVRSSIRSSGGEPQGVYVVKVGGKTDEEIKTQVAEHLKKVSKGGRSNI